MNALEELLDLTRTGEFEDHGSLLLQSSVWRGDSLDLAFRVDHGTGVTSLWTLHCSGVIEYLLTDGRGQIGLNVWAGDHPLLDQHLQPFESLYLSNPPAEPDRVVGQLWSAHVQAVDDWIPFDRYLNREIPLPLLLASGSALLATAPGFLASAYGQVLETNGCEPTRVPAFQPPHSAARLAHFGSSYVVAAEIAASRSSG